MVNRKKLLLASREQINDDNNTQTLKQQINDNIVKECYDHSNTVFYAI